MGTLVSEKTLNSLITKMMPDLELVFVAACQSEFVGSIFKKCGASHVVCVKQSKHVLDEAAIHFTNSFYKHIFSQVKVCEAYEFAKKEVEFKFKKHESDLFTLMTKDDHCCVQFAKREKGKLECLTHHVQIRELPNKLNDIEFREKQISSLVDVVLDKNKPRLVTLLGLRGVGKSAVARNACHYLLERRYFRGGVILIDLNCKKSFEVFVSKLKKIMIKHLKLQASDKTCQRIKKAKDESFIELLEEFFDQSNGSLKLSRKPVNSEKKMKFLLCLENT